MTQHIKTWRERLGDTIPASAQPGGRFEIAMQEENAELRAALDAKRAEASQNAMMAGRVTARQRAQLGELQRTLRAVRALIDGSQPKDLPGAVMAIDAALLPPAENAQNLAAQLRYAVHPQDSCAVLDLGFKVSASHLAKVLCRTVNDADAAYIVLALNERDQLRVALLARTAAMTGGAS